MPVYWIDKNPIVVHAHEVNPIDYAIASVIVPGLRNETIMIFFAKMAHWKIAQETGTTFPLSAENLSVVMKTQFT